MQGVEAKRTRLCLPVAQIQDRGDLCMTWPSQCAVLRFVSVVGAEPDVVVWSGLVSCISGDRAVDMDEPHLGDRMVAPPLVLLLVLLPLLALRFWQYSVSEASRIDPVDRH